MSNAQRISDKSKNKKERKPRLRRIKIDMAKLPEAIIDKKFIVPIGGTVYFERTLDKRTAIHEGKVFSVEETGTITIYDETRDQFFCFNVNQSVPHIKASSEHVPVQEILNGRDMNKHESVRCRNDEGSDSDKVSL